MPLLARIPGFGTALVAVALLLHERSRTRAASKRSKRMRRFAFDVIQSANEGFVCIDERGAIVDWNPVAAATFGWTYEEAIGRDLHELIVPKEFHQAFRDGMARFHRTHESVEATRERTERPALHRDGHRMTIEMTVSAVETEEGWIFPALVHDVTDREAATARLRALAAELERANARLATASRDSSAFLATSAHELNNPLAAITGYASTMDTFWDQLPDEEKRRFVRVIDEQGQRLARLCRDLFAQTRADSSPPRAPVSTDVHEAIGRAIDGLGMDEGIVVHCGSGLRAVSDPDGLQQIVLNLVSNATKYGRTPITIDVDEHDGWVEMAIGDSGDGVREDFVPHLFERYSQASDDPDVRALGTGLGLSIVQSLAQSWGGDIRYEANEPVGSRFVVRLPGVEANAVNATGSPVRSPA